MSKILELNDLKVGKFVNFNLEIKEGWTSIIGPSGSGKTTLIRAIAGMYKYDGEIVIDGLVMNDRNKKTIYKKIGIVFENPDNLFFSETVYDELAFSLINSGMQKKEASTVVDKTAIDFGLNELLKRNPRELSGSEKQLLAIATAVIKKPKLLLIDDGFNRLTESLRTIVIAYLKKQDISVIHLTSTPNISLTSDYIIILDDCQVVADGNIELLKNDKLFTSIGLSQPFMVSLSNKLSYYELVDKTILDMEEMVEKIWE